MTKSKEKSLSASNSSISNPVSRHIAPVPVIEVEDPRNPLDSHPIATVLTQFLARIRDLGEAVRIALPAVGKRRVDLIETQLKNLNKYIEVGADGEAKKLVAEGPHAGNDLLNTTKELDRIKNSRILEVLENSLFIGIFSEYDVFIGNLIQAIHSTKPELFKGIKREISLSDLLEFESVEAVKQDILDKEIDSFRRNSYVEQFCELEKKFDIKTLRDFKEWPNFIESSQRRNLLTHNGGVCSEQYLIVCDREKFIFGERPKTGTLLNLSPDYFFATLLNTAKVGFMLTHTLWRKVLPEETNLANKAMNATIYSLLEDKKWKYAAEFGEFGLSEPMLRKANDIEQRVRVINTSIALRHSNKREMSVALLERMDWSASLRDFQLALAVLKDEYQGASELMKNIGKRGELIDQMAYHYWPLFHDFRDRVEFQAAYESVYGIPFIEKVAEQAQANAERHEEITKRLKQDASELGVDGKTRRRTGGQAVSTKGVMSESESSKKIVIRKRKVLPKTNK